MVHLFGAFCLHYLRSNQTPAVPAGGSEAGTRKGKEIGGGGTHTSKDHAAL